MEQTKWKIPELLQGNNAALTDAGYSPLLAAVLRARGISTPREASQLLGRDLTALSDPFSLSDMDKAVERINAAIASGEKIAVYGDYDADGITASCLLFDYLKGRNVPCQIYIPDRIDEGYGVNAEALENLKDQGVELVITVDCGVTALSETELARSYGIDVVITDHHECPQMLPNALAVINPKRHDSDHPAAGLAGVGVAFKLVCALEGETEKMLLRYADLIALGTVADVMPLVGENRTMVYYGLEKLKTNPRIGLKALLIEAGFAEKPLTAAVVGFSIAPRINAAGRLCQTSKAVELLMCEDAKTAQRHAEELCALNKRRQELETEVWLDAMKILSEEAPTAPIVLAGDKWHPGVAGIAASRLAEEFKLPAVMICIDGDIGKGSCRSYGDFNLFEGLTACSEHLIGFGGHAFAAGMNIEADKIDDFRAAFGQYYAQHLPGTISELGPELLLADFGLLNMEGVESLDSLEPCGSGNHKPLICICDLTLESVSEMSGGKHLRLRVSKNGQGLDAVFFAHTLEKLEVRQGDLVDICFTPQINDYRYRRNVQLLILGIRRSARLENCRELLQKPELSEDDTCGFLLSRQILTTIWRMLKARGNTSRLYLSELFNHSNGELIPEIVCLGIRVFQELSLLEQHIMEGILEIKLREDGERTSLEDSPLFRSLAQ